MSLLQSTLLLATPAWPLLLALLLSSVRDSSHLLRLVPTAGLPALMCVLLPLSGQELELSWLLLGTILGVDETARVFLLFSSVLWITGSLSLPLVRRRQLAIWLLVTMAGNFAVLLSRDIATFFLAFAVMSLATYGLVLHTRTKQARRAARVYLFLAVIAEMVLLSALQYVAYESGGRYFADIDGRMLQDVTMLLLMIGFGVKAGLPLLHMAMPPAYAVVPLAAAVPLAGAMLHLGLYGWLRFLPLGQAASPGWSGVFALTGMLAMVYGVALGLLQRDPRSLLAYSSISQMGLMTLGVGVGLALPQHWPQVQAVLVLFALHHALSKGALFHGLGMQGRARLALWLPALALAGLPFTGGALAKGMFKTQLQLQVEAWYLPGAWFLVLGSIGTTLLMLRFLWLARRSHAPAEQTSVPAWWLLLGLMLCLPWLWPLPVARYSPLWDAAWPVLLAAVLVWIVTRGFIGSWLAALPAVPPGDVLVLMERGLKWLPRPHADHAGHAREYEAVLHPRPPPPLVTVPERLLGRWPLAIYVLVLLLLGLGMLLALGA